MRPNTTPVAALGLSLLAGTCLAAPPLRADDVKVTVIEVLATTDKNAKVPPELAAIAEAVQMKYPDLTGFRMGRTTTRSVAVGHEETFKLVDDQKATVAVVQGKDKKDKVRVEVRPPGIKEVMMQCCCGKFVPFVTPHETRDKKERLIIAVMVNPCHCP